MALPTDVDPGGARSILVVEDHVLVGQFLERALTLAGHVAELISGPSREAVVDRCRQLRPDVVLLDLDLGSLGTSVPLIPALAASGARVMMLTGTVDLAALGECLAAGADDVVSKSQPLEELLQRIQLVVRGDEALGVGRRHVLLEEWRDQQAEEARRMEPFETLSTSEKAVLAALVDGWPLEAIAAARYVSLATVRSQVRAILTKLGVNSQLAAVAAARKANWQAPTPV